MAASNNAKMIRNKLATIIIAGNLPLNYGECNAIVSLFTFLNPKFRKITEREILQEASELFDDSKIELRSTFASLGKNIALACDVWCSEHIGRKFLRVTAHWIDSDWVMQRRVLDFVRLDDSLYDDMIKQTIDSMFSWGIKDKVYSFTFDDVTNAAAVVEDLKGVVCPVLNGKLFHSNCVVRILNSCLENAWEIVKAQVDMIWRGVCIIRNNFKLFCERYGYVPKLTVLYEERKWDTIRELLRTFIPYKDAVSEFVASFPWNEPSVPVVISERHWEVAALFCRILNVFYVAVDDISSNYKPSSCVVLRQLVNVAKLFSELKESVMFNEKFSAMKEIFLQNFDKIPEIYCVAAVMDPRIKLLGCECLLEAFYEYTDNVTVNVEEEIRGISKLLHEMYNLYAVKSTKGLLSPDTATNDHAWSLISRKRKTIVDSAFEELAIYLQSPPIVSANLDILAWWKDTEISYPVLSAVARDLLTIPLSTLAPDSAFFLNKNKLILDERASRFSESDAVMDIHNRTSESFEKQKLELCICLKDWLNAEKRTQGKRELVYDDCLGPEDEEECSESDDDD